MPAATSMAAFLEGYTPCRRHPSRRGVGWCETCGRDLCRECLLPEHLCPGARRAAARPRRHALRTRATVGAPLLLVALGLALVYFGSRRPAPTRAGGSPAAPASPASHQAEIVPPAAAPARETARPAPAPAPTPAPPGAALPAAPPARPLHHLPAARPRSFNRGPVDRRALVLSFDAGAEASGAEEILDILSCYRVRTTFFLTGEFIRTHPHIVRRLVAEGHEVGNHTDTHLHLTEWEARRRHSTSPEVNRHRLLAELERAAAAFRALTGQDMAPLWRAPYGEYNEEILAWAAAAGWRHVGWTEQLDSLDWVADPASRIYRNPDEIASSLLAFAATDPAAGRGAIILMHLGSQRPREERPARTLPRLLEGYRSRGFAFVTASAMMRGLPRSRPEL